MNTITKIILIFLLLVGFIFSAGAQLVTNKTARFKTKVVFSDAKSNGGEVVTSISPSPEGTSPVNETKDTGTSPGREYELVWKFVGRNGDKDVYHFTFTRMTKAGVTAKVTTSKDILFDGRRVIIFEDDLHTVLIESPTAEDLKPAANPI